MSTLYSASAWANFNIASASAAGALAGLVMVAVSVNVGEIVKHPHLPARAGAAIWPLVLILVVNIAGLIPQPTSAFAAEAAFFAAVTWVAQARSAYEMLWNREKAGRPLSETLRGVLISQVEVIPFLVGGGLLLTGRAGGGYWIAGGVIVTFALSVLNAWVLLIEILR